MVAGCREIRGEPGESEVPKPLKIVYDSDSSVQG